jgi:hypothetical protein
MAQSIIILECERLRGEAQQVRTAAMRSSIAAALTFCSVAENEARWHSRAKALSSLERIGKFIRVAQWHIDDPHHVVRGAAIELQNALDRLKTRMGEASQLVTRRPASPP